MSPNIGKMLMILRKEFDEKKLNVNVWMRNEKGVRVESGEFRCRCRQKSTYDRIRVRLLDK
jgi:hypothetical protein